METKTLQITKDAAFKAHENAKSSGKTLLENLFGKRTFLKDPMDRIKTFEDVLGAHELDEKQFDESCAGLTPDEIAYKKVKLIVQSLNGDWTPDWTDGGYKYYPWFNMGSPSGVGFSYGGYDNWGSRSFVGSRLCYKSSELAKYAGKQFEDIYKEFLTI